MIDCGFKSLLFIGYEGMRLSHRQRISGFCQAVKRAGVQGEIFETEDRYKSSFERGYYQFSSFLNQKRELPEAVIAASDATANGVIKACMERSADD